MTQLTFAIDLSECEIAAIEHDVPDVSAWVESALRGKAHQCSKRMAAAAAEALKADASVDTMPATNDGLITAMRARPSYRKRATRDLAQQLLNDVEAKLLSVQRIFNIESDEDRARPGARQAVAEARGRKQAIERASVGGADEVLRADREAATAVVAALEQSLADLDATIAAQRERAAHGLSAAKAKAAELVAAIESASPEQLAKIDIDGADWPS